MMETNEHQTPCRRVPVSKSRDPQPWTASRCHRLLRPLLSQLAALKKDISTSPHGQPSAVEGKCGSPQKRPAKSPKWTAPRKKMRHTYSRRSVDRQSSELQTVADSGTRYRRAGELQQHIDDAAGQVPVSPLLRRARGQMYREQGSEAMGLPQAKQSRRRNALSDQPVYAEIVDHCIRPNRSQLPTSGCREFSGILRSLGALLSATGDQHVVSKGVQSFLKICLKKVPDYISGVQAWYEYEAEKNGTKRLGAGDMSFQVYSDLESIGPTAFGWRHLRTVVRADGLHAIRQAMSEGLFSDYFSMLVIDTCVQYGAAGEAEDLIEELVTRHYPAPLNPDSTFEEDPEFNPLSFMWTFAEHTERHGFLLRQFTRLLSDGSLPHGWVCSPDFEQLFEVAQRILSKVESSMDASNFLVTSLAILSRQQRYIRAPIMQNSDYIVARASQRSLINCLGILAAMHLLGEEELGYKQDLAQDVQSIDRLGHSIMYILQACNTEVRHFKGRRSKLGDHLLHFGLFFASSSSCHETTELHLNDAVRAMTHDQLTERSGAGKHARQDYDAMITLMTSIARICSRGTCQSSHVYLQKLCKRLSQLEVPANLVENAARAGAFLLAQQTSNVRDLIYAEKLASKSALNASPTQRTLFVGYRWDDGINEFVTVSPIARRRAIRRRSIKTLAEMDSCLHNSPRSAEMSPSVKTRMLLSPSPPPRLIDLPSSSSDSDDESEREPRADDGAIPPIPGDDFTVRVTQHQPHPRPRRHAQQLRRDALSSGFRELTRDELSGSEQMPRASGRHSWGTTLLRPRGRRRIRFSGEYHSDGEDELGL